MSSSLKDNLSSSYIDAFASLLPKAKPSPILVYVESEEDISFWKKILNPFENEHISFQVNLPSTTLAKGKKAALQRNAELLELIENGNIGRRLIVCVDSDYDYLLPVYRPEARLVNESPYIFQTYSYAMENLKCYAESLHLICTAATYNDTELVDFGAFMKLYSTIVYELFIWNLYFYSKKDFETFSITEFCKLIHIENFSPEDLGKKSLQDLKQKVDAKSKEFMDAFSGESSELESMKNELKHRGLSEECTYLFLKGHVVFDNVVMNLLKPVCKKLSDKHRERIRNSNNSKEVINNNLNQYENNMKLQKIESLLSNNTEFKNCFLYKKLHQDLEMYVKSF